MLKAFFCDAAHTEQGKLHLHGIYNELLAEGFPARHDRLLLCALLEWPHHTEGRREFIVDLLDPGAQSVFTVEGHTDIGARDPTRAPAQTHLILPLQQVVFPVAGCYRAVFRIEGEQQGETCLYLRQARNPQHD